MVPCCQIFFGGLDPMRLLGAVTCLRKFSQRVWATHLRGGRDPWRRDSGVGGVVSSLTWERMSSS